MIRAYIGAVSAAIYDTVVVGGGVIGLSSAFALAEQGQSVALIDDAVGSGASYAAAGMLAPGAESSPEHALFAQRAVAARLAWPSFLNRINTAASTSCDMSISGTLFVGWDADDRREWRRYFDTAHTHGIASAAISRDSAPPTFAGVSTRIDHGEYVASDAYVDPDEVLLSLIRATEKLGVTYYRDRALHCDVKDKDAITEISGETIRSRSGVIATGFQREPLEILRLATHRVRPVRGVTLRLRTSPSDAVPMVRACINGRHVYVVRRDDGSILIGASSDEFPDLVVEAGAVRRLLEDATTIMPEIDEATFVEARVGLRPATDDQIPFFDVIDDGAWAWSGGHYRHGFLMAPLASHDALVFSASRLS